MRRELPAELDIFNGTHQVQARAGGSSHQGISGGRDRRELSFLKSQVTLDERQASEARSEGRDEGEDEGGSGKRKRLQE